MSRDAQPFDTAEIESDEQYAEIIKNADINIIDVRAARMHATARRARVFPHRRTQPPPARTQPPPRGRPRGAPTCPGFARARARASRPSNPLLCGAATLTTALWRARSGLFGVVRAVHVSHRHAQGPDL